KDEGGHVERGIRVVGVAAAELEQLTRLHARLGEPGAERAAHQVATEDLVAGRDRGVDREHRITAHPPQRLTGGEAGLRDDELARSLQEQERRVALVEMPDLRRKAQGAKGADSTDSEDELLAEPHLAAADVEDVRD